MKARFKPKYNIRKGDNVVVIAGDDKDLAKPRVVKEVLVDDAKVIVEGVNMISKHSKPNAKSPNGGITKQEGSVHISNVMFVEGGKTVRIGRQIDEKTKHTVRISKKTKEVIK